MPVNIDFTGVSTEGFAALDAGNYPAKIAKWETGTSQSSKQPIVTFEFALTEPAGRKHWETYSLQANSLWKLKGDLTNLGLELPEGPFDLEEFLRDADLIDREVILEMTQEDHWQGKKDAKGQVLKQNRASMHAIGSSDTGW
jgi:hypothetical protein